MNMMKWLEEQLKAEKKKAMPVLSFPSISILGISVNELIADADKQAEGMKAIAERTNSCAST